MYFYVDFEYRKNNLANEIVLISYMASNDKLCKTIDLRDGSNRDVLAGIVEKYKDYIWVAYNAIADLTCLQALGIDISGLKVIDAMVEARMVTLTLPSLFQYKGDLLTSLHAFGIKSAASAGFKKDVRNIILNNRQYSHWKWKRIKAYGPTDVKPLPDLLKRVWQAHQNANSPITLSEMLHRGNYVKALAILSFNNKGFPIDQPWLNAIFENKVKIIRYLQQQVNVKYGQLYIENKSKDVMHFNYNLFKKMILNKGYIWDITEKTKRPRLDKIYLKKKVHQYPEIKLFYYVKKTLLALEVADLTSQCIDGHIKPAIFPFAQKTGRNSHKPSKGFMLNITPWMRSIIKPKPNTLIIGADWSQQEIAIAAVLSGDKKYIDVYNDKEGDVYLTLAKMAGAVPIDATKSSHPQMRQTFKAIQLGLGYGKGIDSLAVDVYESNKDANNNYSLSSAEAFDLASNIYHWHKSTFSTYWEWIDDVMTIGRSDGFIRSVDGWTYFIDDNVRDTQLLNLPMQSNGAAMLRRAVIYCNESEDIDLICTLHDALYITCNEQDRDKAIELLTNCMNKACRDILGDKVQIRIDIGEYNHENGYNDPRGDEMLTKIKELLCDIAA